MTYHPFSRKILIRRTINQPVSYLSKKFLKGSWKDRSFRDMKSFSLLMWFQEELQLEAFALKNDKKLEKTS